MGTLGGPVGAAALLALDARLNSKFSQAIPIPRSNSTHSGRGIFPIGAPYERGYERELGVGGGPRRPAARLRSESGFESSSRRFQRSQVIHEHEKTPPRSHGAWRGLGVPPEGLEPSTR